jgi:hypothetical protein
LEESKEKKEYYDLLCQFAAEDVTCTWYSKRKKISSFPQKKGWTRKQLKLVK